MLSILTSIWNGIKNFIKQFNSKDLAYFILIGVTFFIGWCGSIKNKNTLDDMNISYKQLSENIIRAQSEVVTKSELKEFGKSLGSNFSEINKDLNSLNANLKAVGITTVEINGKLETNMSGNSIIIDHLPPPQPAKCSLCDIYNYTIKIQSIDVSLGSMPMANVKFDASLDKPWTIQTDNIEFKVSTVVGEQSQGNLVFYHTISMYNKSRKELENKEFKLKIVNSEYKQVIKGKEFYWFAPAIDISLVNTLSIPGLQYHIGGVLGLSFLGYGTNQETLDYRFLILGTGFTNESLILTLSPVRYNIGRNIKWLTNVWIGLDAIWNTNDNTFGIGASLGARL